jgi:two-component system, cell cycle response regulator DivK
VVDPRRSTVSSPRLVLVVEDDFYTREMYSQWLAFSGFRVAQATAAEDALEKARSLRPDLITTEIQFESGKNGLQLCAELKRSEGTKSIPIIAVTAWEMGGCVEKARQAGCDLVLVKPCLPETLLAEVQRLLNLPITKLKPRPVRR